MRRRYFHPSLGAGQATSAEEFALLTNAEVLAVSAASTGNRAVKLSPATRAANTVVWTANATGTDAAAEPTVYVAFVKRAQIATTATVRANVDTARVYAIRVRVQLIRHFKTCTTDIYLQNECAHVGLSVHAPVYVVMISE